MASRPCHSSGGYLPASYVEYSLCFKGDMCGICGVENGARTCLPPATLVYFCNLPFQKYFLFVCLL
jgi:hypothetical protein